MNNVRFGIVVLLIVILGGCSGMTNKKRVTVLQDSIDDYVQALRWGRLDDAVAYHVNRDGTRAEINLAPMEPIRVTGYHIKEKVINEDFTEATVSGELSYYHNEYGTLKKIPLRQKWWYEEESGRWFLESDFPTFE
jgi:hypothetical protein